jgi:hypothetical protein
MTSKPFYILLMLYAAFVAWRSAFLLPSTPLCAGTHQYSTWMFLLVNPLSQFIVRNAST